MNETVEQILVIVVGILGWVAMIGSTYWVAVTYGAGAGVVYGLFGAGLAFAVPMLIVGGLIAGYEALFGKK